VKKFFLLAILVFSSVAGFAQEGFLAAPAERDDFWICLGADMAFYSYSSLSAGGSLAAAYGNKFSIGFKAVWFFDTGNELDVLEINLLLRYYFLGGAPSAESAPSNGPFLQLTGGPAIFFDREEGAVALAHWGRVSAGLTFGWRFLFGKIFFAEPYIRAGYPYIVGAGVSAGVRF